MRPLIRVLKACGDPNRMRILKMLQHREMCVCELTEALGIAQPSVSRHLRILEEADLVECTREGLWINYRLTTDPPDPYAGVLLQHIEKWLEEDPGIRALIEKAATLDREVICRRKPSGHEDTEIDERGI
jgi:ArsR family transcriptional regulator